MTTLWHNGKFLKATIPQVRVTDSGYTNAIGICTVMPSIDGAIPHIHEHYARLTRDAKTVLDITPPLNEQEFCNIIHALLKENGLDKEGRARLRVQITGGVLNGFLEKVGIPNIIFTCTHINAEQKQEEANAWVIEQYPRIAECVLENCKRLDYTRAFCALRDARKNSGNEAITTNTDGNIACASSSALLIVEGTALITPPLEDGVLDSISRRILIRNHGARQERITPDRLNRADAIILTNTVRGARVVSTLDGARKAPAPADLLRAINAEIFKTE